MESRSRETACCCKCKYPPPGEFKKIIDLRNSGLDIYIHENTKDQKVAGKGDKHSFVLHNKGTKELKRPDYIREMSQYKTRCLKCKRLVAKVHSLIDKIEEIKKNQVLGVCDYCGGKSKNVNCKRCEYVLKKYMCHRDNTYQCRKAKYLAYINKMYSVLRYFLNRESSCRHKMYQDDRLELVIEEIISELKRTESPEPRIPKHRQTRETKFPPISKVHTSSKKTRIYTNKSEKLMEVIKAYEPKFSAYDSLQPSNTSACVCKFITEDMLQGGELNDDSIEKITPACDAETHGPPSVSKITALEDILVGKEIEIGATENNISKKLTKDSSEEQFTKKGRRKKDRRDSSEKYYTKGSKSSRIDWSDNDFSRERHSTYSGSDHEFYSRRHRYRSDLSDEDISRRGRHRRGVPDEYIFELKKMIRDWSDEDIPRRVRNLMDWLNEYISKKGRPKRNTFDDFASYTKRPKRSWSEDDIIRGQWYRRGMSEERISERGREITLISEENISRGRRYEKESPQERYFKTDSSEEDIPRREMPKKYNLDGEQDARKEMSKSEKPEYVRVPTLKTLKDRSDEYLARAKKEKGTRKIQEEKNKKSEKRILKQLVSKIVNTNANTKSTKEKSKDLLDTSSNKENIPIKSSSQNVSKSQSKLEKKSKSENSLLKFLNERKTSREIRSSTNERIIQEKTNKSTPIFSLPKVRKLRSQPIKAANQSTMKLVKESFVKCDDSHLKEHTNEMVRGTVIIPYDPHYKDKPIVEQPPLLFKIEMSFHDELKPTLSIPEKPSTTNTLCDISSKKSEIKWKKEEAIKTTGILKYALSDEVFIVNGVTVLPTSKIMRRMNIYKMKPANAHFDWFKHNVKKEEMFYDTGEKLAEIYANGNGKWFYKNGRVALDYYTATEQNVRRRYIIYSSGLEKVNGKPLPITVLACFDHLGNGVVYDHFGNVRLKYNQSEGIVVDRKIGPPSKWKWHTLNDPPVLQPVYIETTPKNKDPRLDELMNISKENKKQDDPAQYEKLKVEFENFVKEKASKVLLKFKPFQIRMKAVKINEHFSLRVLDQTNVSLLFQDVPISLKLNLGMQLIIDVETAEVSEVFTPYDRFPPRTKSVADIQKVLKRARKFKGGCLLTDTKGCEFNGPKTFNSDSRIAIL